MPHATEPNRALSFLPRAQDGAAEVLVLTLYRGGTVDWHALGLSLLHQSLQAWRWVVIADAVDAARIEQELSLVGDSRVRVALSGSAAGLACSTLIRETNCSYGCLLDQLTTIEPTFLEKAVWLLATQAQVACCAAHVADSTQTWPYGLEQGERCVVILSNDVRAEPLFPGIVKFILGETGMPWSWEYGAHDWAKP